MTPDSAKCEARERLLRPLSDHDAATLPLVTREELDAALRRVAAITRPIRRWPCY